ncbi:response regulator transcription factor [Xylophilus sp. GOD-11R]|uniref:response regulator transcription factor n=1 Tax=Xylophilus sp. GOD-11R TaxID=3089814 RepID=UPI00298C2BAB|nr:response regulator transcription factor [Xylophilus sp. GOD-11R]WPB58097.1 response regulator transcription factor [Xylophilus sp. GOD-11R]
MRVAILEDDSGQTARIMHILSGISIGDASVSVQAFTSGQRLRSVLRHETFDLLVLAWNGAELNGIEILDWLRKFQQSNTPAIILSSYYSEQDIVRAFGRGADDYVVQPVRSMEFRARAMRLLQRHTPAPALTQLVFGPWTLDRTNTTARIALPDGEKTFELTEREFRLALALFQHRGSSISRAHLLEYSGVCGEEINSRALDSHIYRLRGKLFLQREHGAQLRTVYGHGYRLEMDDLQKSPAPTPSPTPSLSSSPSPA